MAVTWLNVIRQKVKAFIVHAQTAAQIRKQARRFSQFTAMDKGMVIRLLKEILLRLLIYKNINSI